MIDNPKLTARREAEASPGGVRMARVSGKEFGFNKKTDAAGDNPVRLAADGKDYWELFRVRIKEIEGAKHSGESGNG